MNKSINNIATLPSKLLPILSDDEAAEKYCRWSYVNIYSLKDLKDIFLISQLTPLNQLMKFTGHSKLSTLQGYIDPSREVDTNPIKIFNRK